MSTKTLTEKDRFREGLRSKIIGLGERSLHKSYYPELQKQLADLERFKYLLDQSNDAVFLLRMPSGRIVDVNRSACRQLGYSWEELTAREIDSILPPESAQKVHGFTDEAGESLLFETELVRKDGQRCYYEVNMRTAAFRDGLYTVAVMRDISERRRADERLQESFRRLSKMTGDVIGSISKLVELRDPYTAGHQRRVSQLAFAIAQEMQVPRERAEGIRIAGLLHDIGKLYVPAEILSKPGRLSAAEFDIIKVHPGAGYEILRRIEFPWPVAEITRQHQERLDGSGYPRGLRAEDILPETKIVSVADTVEAMTFHRPYRAELGVERALAEISAKQGSHFDPAPVTACLRLFREKGFLFER